MSGRAQAEIDRALLVGPAAIVAQSDVTNIALVTSRVDCQFRRWPLGCSFGFNLHEWTPDDSPVRFHERISPSRVFRAVPFAGECSPRKLWLSRKRALDVPGYATRLTGRWVFNIDVDPCDLVRGFTSILCHPCLQNLFLESYPHHSRNFSP